MSSALRKAAQQALEALEALQGGCTDHDDGTVEAITVWCPEVITALRAALAEPDVPETDFGNMAVAVAEPVASVTECEACFTPDVCQLRGTCDHYAAERLRVAAPPQREPLTDDEIHDCFQQRHKDKATERRMITRAIERAHGIGGSDE